MRKIISTYLVFWLVVGLCIVMPFLIPPAVAYFVWRFLRFRKRYRNAIYETQHELYALRSAAEFRQRVERAKAWP